MKQKRWLLILLISCSALMANAQVLYKCTNHDRDTIIYLLGTHHQLPIGSFQIDPVISGILQETDLVFTEIGQGDTSAAYRNYQRKLENVFSFPDKKRLDDYLTSSELYRIKRFYGAEFSIPERVFNLYSRYRPIMMDLTLKKQYTNSVDNKIRIIASALHKELRTLDREEDILRTYSWMVESVNPDSLLRMIDNSTYLRFFNSQLERSYLNQDTAAIAKAFIATTPEPFIEEVLLKRNNTWINILNAEIRKTNFIAVGIMHIYFRGGLLAYYAGKGYQIEAIPIVLKNANW